MQQNAHKYGYIVRYPKNKGNITGYGYEPWHIRYVGVKLSKILYDKNLTLDEYYKYKLNSDIIERETYAYYDDLLTRNSKGDIKIDKAILDDIVKKENVDKKNSESDEEQVTKNPASILVPTKEASQSKNPSTTDEPKQDDEVQTQEPTATAVTSTQEPTAGAGLSDNITTMIPEELRNPSSEGN